MTQLDGTLSDLARLRSGSEPIVSLYLDTRWGDEQQRERVRLFVQEKISRTLRHYAEGAPGRSGLERTLERVQGYVAGLTAQAYESEKNGLALFGCQSIGLWRPLFFGRSFQPELCTDGFCHLTQLARLADDFEPAIVVAPSQAGADIFQVTLGDLALESHPRGFVPRRERDEYSPGMHGRRQYERESKDERRQEAWVQKNRKASAQEVVSVFDRTPGCHVVLVGTSEAVAAFERELPERAREHVIARIPRPRAWDNGNGMTSVGAIAGASTAVAEHEREKEHQVIDAVVGQSLRGGLAVMGPDDVVEALNQKRVHKLVLEEDFTFTGWRCENCDAIGANAETQEVCPYCGGDVKVLQHLGEAMVTRALAEGAEVEVVAHANKLHSYRSVGAFLRQTAANGLRGAHPWPTAPGASQGG